ncbi:MAG: DNA polymerase I, partial [Candidatus Magasanikbacteria bacterium]|nr:DNA polymerase I [Candidatus Magasanikbacteria bacterium]
MPKKTFIIIDGNAIIHRAYHAIPPLTVKDGTMVHAVYGFTSMLLKMLHDLKPDYMAVSFDVAGGTFRDDIYTEYKATRVKADQALYDQIPLVHQMVEAFGIPIYEKEGFEADDVIGTITKEQGIKNKEQVTSIIVSGDQDLLQLVQDDNVEVYLLKKGMSDFQLYNETAVKEKFGFGPERMVDYKALRGDTSDNIPGVPGIGEKGAKELIEKIGGIEEIYSGIKNEKLIMNNGIKPGVVKKLIEGVQSAKMSKELATIRQDVPDLEFDLEKCKIGEFDREKITELFRKFEFYSLIKRLPGTPQDESTETTKKTKTSSTHQSLIIADKKTLPDILESLKQEPIIACKEILSGDNVLASDLLGLLVATSTHSYYIEKPNAQVLALFEDEQKIIVAHDIKRLIKVVKWLGGHVNAHLFDIMIASYIINSSTRAHDLKSIVLRELGAELPAGSDQITLFGVDPKIASKELRMIFDVYQIYRKKLKDQNDLRLFEDIEMGLVPVLADMEVNGIAVDLDLLKNLSVEVTSEISTLEKKIWKEAGEEFNVASSVQLRDVLFDKLGMPTQSIKKGKTGYSTSASELEKLHGEGDIIEYIEQYRELEKLRNTYIDVLPTLINKKTGRIHTTYNQAVASTGRLSSSDPNLQNIPIRTELGKKVRDAFISEPGNVLITADYSQIELR